MHFERRGHLLTSRGNKTFEISCSPQLSISLFLCSIIWNLNKAQIILFPSFPCWCCWAILGNWGLTNSYDNDWFTDVPRARLAKLKVKADFVAPCNTSILYPAAGGNMHCFTAVTACAVLDVLGPPYSDPDGRHCTYYREHPFDRFPGTSSFLFCTLVWSMTSFHEHSNFGIFYTHSVPS